MKIFFQQDNVSKYKFSSLVVHKTKNKSDQYFVFENNKNYFGQFVLKLILSYKVYFLYNVF